MTVKPYLSQVLFDLAKIASFSISYPFLNLGLGQDEMKIILIASIVLTLPLSLFLLALGLLVKLIE